MRHVLLTLAAAAIGWSIGAVVGNRETLMQLWYHTYEQHYLIRTQQTGPVTWLVTHRDYDALRRFALALDDVRTVEPGRHPNIAAVAFRRADTPAIAAVANFPNVQDMRRAFVPLLTH